MSRSDPFDEELRDHRKRGKGQGPGRARGRGYYWGGYWGATGVMTGYLGQEHQPPDDGDHLGAQFNGIAGATEGSASVSGGDGSAGG